jgi:hypothetical protein
MLLLLLPSALLLAWTAAVAGDAPDELTTPGLPLLLVAASATAATALLLLLLLLLIIPALLRLLPTPSLGPCCTPSLTVLLL